MDSYYLSLCILFFATNWFWAHQNSKLVNKLMSRNYSDYKVSDSIADKKVNNKPSIPTAPLEDFGSLEEIYN